MSTESALGPRSRDFVPAALLRLASDRRLVEQFQAGSGPAFEALFDRHRGPVLAFCRRMLTSPDEAEDAMQQTFLAAYSELVRAETPRALRPWLYAIARHRCLAMLRARRERPGGEPAEAATDDLFAEVTTREDLRALLTDVARLPDAQRTAIVLAELGGIPYEEIARRLACPREKVKALVFQARSSLAAGRAARETPCAEIREQLATLRGGALRRSSLRRHIRDCPGCRAFRDEIRGERRRLRLLHPLSALVGLKRAVLGGLPGSGGGAGVAVSVGSVSGGGLTATVLATVAAPLAAVAVPVAAVALAVTSSLDGGDPSRAFSPAALSAAGGARAPAHAAAGDADAEPTASARARDHSSAGPGAGMPAGDRLPQTEGNDTGMPSAAPRFPDSREESVNGDDERTQIRPSDGSQPGDSVSRPGGREPTPPTHPDPPTPPSGNRPPAPERPVSPATPPKGPPVPARRPAPAAPPRANGQPPPPASAAPGRPATPAAPPERERPAPPQDRAVTPPAPAPTGGSTPGVDTKPSPAAGPASGSATGRDRAPDRPQG